jgi:type I restriction enzyme R subunit
VLVSNFAFLADEFPAIHASAVRAETLAVGDPRASAFYARRTLEVAVHWIYKHDPALKSPYDSSLSALLHEPSFKITLGQAVFAKARLIVAVGNRAVHEPRETQRTEAVQAVTDLFHVCFWLARTYARRGRPADDLVFDPKLLNRKDDALKIAFGKLQQMSAELAAKDEDLAKVLRDRDRLDEELRALRAEVAEAKRANLAVADHHDYAEAETRDAYIDVLLREAGWPLANAEDREYPIEGMPNTQGVGYADYVLWGDDGKPLAVIEAKRTKRDPREGQQQAKLYADGLERKFGQRPVIFYSNGYEHWIWDDAAYPPREIQGFLKKDELARLIERRSASKPLAGLPVDRKIVERYYQRRAIEKMGQAFEAQKQRRALLVMATGSGKTRTVIALVDALMRANWVKRVLFLADRVTLVNQAVAAFKAHLPNAATVNLVTDKSSQGRVYASTYPTMMRLIDQKRDEGRQFGVGHFDLVIIDEAHRSVYQRYGAIFDYFDSLLVGLTATPRDEIDRNTYGLFQLEDGVPTDYYSLEQAVADDYLVPPEAVSVPLKFQREGINYDDLSATEKDQWDMLEWDEDGPPDSVDPQAVNKWLFNEDTVDKVLAHLMTHGLKVGGGDQLGKTIIFAKNQAHAEFIEQRFNAAYPALAGHFARVITFKTEYAQSLIDDFATKDKAPHIAISVDMLDTGIDVPEVLNLVLFKLIRSKTKFWQILGRGTRLCSDLFGPGRDKECFYVFDFCQNLEFFSQNPKATDGATGKGLSERLFEARLDLIARLDEKAKVDKLAGLSEPGAPYDAGEVPAGPKDEAEVREHTLAALRAYVSGMNLDNFIVRPHRRAVEKFQRNEGWLDLDESARHELVDEVAALPTDKFIGTEPAKRFDLLMLNMQLALLKASKSFGRLRQQLIDIAAALEEQFAIPAVAAQQELIQEVQSETWWQGVTVPLLEVVRLRLRDLVQHVEKSKRPLVYSDFEDEAGEGQTVELPQIGAVDFNRFKRKARHFLLEHDDNLALQKLRRGRPLTPTDIDQLGAMLLAAGVGDQAQLDRARELGNGLGPFIRSLVGLDRGAVVEAFSTFTADGATADQMEFIEMIIDHLTEKGAMDPRLLYESPFTDVAPAGPEQVFPMEKTNALVAAIEQLNRSAFEAVA